MSPESKPIGFKTQLSIMVLFGFTGMVTEIFVSAATDANPIFAHTVKDAFYAAGAAAVFHQSEGSLKSILMGFGLLAIAEVGQGILQSLHLTDKGFSELDFAAYAIGAFILFPLIHQSARLLHNSK